jgi:hypothetical protein
MEGMGLVAPSNSVIRWLPVSNQSGVIIPAFALMRVTGMDTDGNFTVAQPNTNGQINILVNGPWAIPIGGNGQGHCITPCCALYETADQATPAFGDTWGAGSGSWKLRKGNAGATIVGVGADGGGLVSVAHSFSTASVVTDAPPDEKVKVSSDDTTADYLENKITGAGIVSVTEQNEGGNEYLQVSAAATDYQSMVRYLAMLRGA